jgi:hypothetical protein
LKFLSIYTPDEKRAGVLPTEEQMAEMGQLIEESMKARHAARNRRTSADLKRRRARPTLWK